MSATSRSGMPLAGVRVIDLSRLAPGPYCTMLLADLGAEVISVGGGRAGNPVSSFSRGKRFMKLDLKADAGQEALLRLTENADVVVESFRPGVAERIGADYPRLSAANPRLIYCSLTGYGQSGPLAQAAGHDINYLALGGILGAIGPADAPPSPPLNLLADFAGGSFLAAFGIVSALFERSRTERGQYIDAAMIDGCLSLMSMHFPVWGSPVLPGRGRGLLGGGAPYYRCYECADGGYVAVGALEPRFFVALWDALFHSTAPDHMDTRQWPAIEAAFDKCFRSKARDEWTSLLRGGDVCVEAVLAPDEVWSHPQIAHRHPGSNAGTPPVVPRFGAQAGKAPALDTRDQTDDILRAIGLTDAQIALACPGHERERVPSRQWPPGLKS